MTHINSTPSFHGANNIFKKRILTARKTFTQIADENQNDYVGSLPNEIIKEITKLTKTPLICGDFFT